MIDVNDFMILRKLLLNLLNSTLYDLIYIFHIYIYYFFVFNNNNNNETFFL